MLIYDHAAAFDEVRDLQFAATTYVCPGRFAYVGFRGTDTTLTGWREDFNMAYQAPVEAQALAARYLAAVAADPRLPEALILGGHSKGGNLAEYAALAAAPEVQQAALLTCTTTTAPDSRPVCSRRPTTRRLRAA